MSGAREMSPYFGARVALAVFLLLSLAGCAWQQTSWDEYASKTETIKLFTFVPCDTNPQAIPEHQTYYHAWYFDRYDSAYWIGWADARGKQNNGRRIFIIAVWYIGVRDYTEIKPAYPDSRERSPTCAVLLAVPSSEAGKRAFFAEGDPATAPQRAAQAAGIASLAELGVMLLLGIAGAYVIAGDAHGLRERPCTITLGVIFVVTLGALLVSTLPAWNVRRLADYYDFYNHLPRGEVADLLPMSWAQVRTLISGPPFPSESELDYQPFYTILSCTSVFYLTAFAPWIAFGVYCVHAADPFRELRQKAKRRGTPPTPDEYMAVVAEAALTKGTWELEVLRRRAQALGLADRDSRRS
jgi:hypothetical protein